MTSLQQLNQYLRSVERRLRLIAATRGAAITVLLALLMTVVMVWVSNRFAFAQNVVLPLRILLFLSVASALAALLGWPLYRLNRRRVLEVAERNAPEFEQRLLTVHEKSAAEDPWSELLAEDALKIARRQPVERFASTQQVYGFTAGLLAAAGLLLWLVTAGPGYWGYGAALLWTGSGDAAKRPLYDISVAPGNKTIRRKTDQVITAKLNGFSSDHVSLYVKYGSSLRWDRTAMQPTGEGDQYRFLFAGLSDQVEYYVTAKHAVSQHFKIGVRDLPGVQHVKVDLHYPSGLGLENVVLEPAGDIRAVIGTNAKISVLTDRPLLRGQLIFNDGKKIDLVPGEGNWLSSSISVEKDGSYHVAAIDNGETIRISDDYIIEARKDEPPSVKILKPGADPKVSPIEELPVTVTASDDYGIQDLQLHYSVNGGPEQTASLLKNKGSKEAEGKTTLYFENFKVAPGDMVSFYATAKDAKTTAHSDIVFAQAEPFDYKFSQSQQSGGGGGGGMGNESNDISKRQKQVIAATFNEINDKTKARAIVADDAKFLSDLQGKLGAQAKTLSDRMGSREMGASGQQFQQFSQLMTQASTDMNAAADQLKPGKWNDALVPEQKALTSLLRADALFRDIQIAYGQMGGGGGGNSGAQRDLARMLDLELDTSKNQYETGQTPQPEASSAEKSKALDDAFEKLQALARRQQELAAQNAQRQAFEQRWQEEQLRREAEELRQELKKLAQDSQSGSQGQQQQGQQSGQQQAQSGQSGQSQSGSSKGGQQSASSGSQGSGGQRQTESLQRAGNSLSQAEEEMRKAAGNNDAGARDRAAARLREAQQEISQMMRDQSGKSVADMQAQAQQLAQAQKSVAERMKQMYGTETARNSLRNTFGQGDEGEMPEMNDPNSRRWGYGFRRPYNLNQTPGREATESEKALANEKDKLAGQLEQLQRQMQAQSQNLAGSRPDAASKLSRALSEAEGKELALRMQKNAEWMRQGYGDRNLRVEDSVTAGLEQLSKELKGVRETLDGSPTAGGKQSDKTAQALAEVQDLRQQLERQKAARNGSAQDGQQQAKQNSNSNGSQSGSSQSGGAQQGGSQQGANSGSRQNGDDMSRTGNGQLALGRPGLNGGGNGADWNREALDREGVQSAIRQLNSLRAVTNPNDRALYGSIDGALGNLHHLTAAQDGLLDARLSQNALSSLERLEVELSKRVGQDGPAGTRTGAQESSPEKYREAVAGYFRRLSQTGTQSAGTSPK